ncbi:hypothetical protein GY31_15520 [Lysinibacillus sphaericus]|uniref:Uncharacterized protein n=1 Tax=Lysinibacillus sphaericus TaxID=1421 RepID=A0A2S5D573_LYSSH|nr:hypothetical protein GY31_15520 [Lysinibacillus sphaericus]POZ58127.1 hypothetical protein LYSIN_02911 [Lysinibacillus sphaericus]
MKQRKNINVSEAILLVSSFFMFMYISKNMIFVNEFSDFFERSSLWLILPCITLVIGIISFVSRKV